MSTFQGTMRIEGQGGSVPVQARVRDQLLVLEVEGVSVGEWPVAGLAAEVDPAGVVLRLGEETVTIDVSDPTGFARTLQAPAAAVSRRRRWRPGLPSLAVATVSIGVVVAALVAPRAVGASLLLGGLLGLVAGALAYSDPRVALRLPLHLHAVHVLAAGLVLLGLGVALVLVA